ncbi:hypothetical protein OCOL_000226 [Ordospora colligata]
MTKNQVKRLRAIEKNDIIESHGDVFTEKVMILKTKMSILCENNRISKYFINADDGCWKHSIKSNEKGPTGPTIKLKDTLKFLGEILKSEDFDRDEMK